MKSLHCGVLVLSFAGSLTMAGAPIYICPDVPTTESATATTLLESQVYRFNSTPSYVLALTVGGGPTLDAIHKMDKTGRWLFSVEARNDLGGGLGGALADPRDVILYDVGTGSFSVFFCGALAGIPDSSNVDALALFSGDAGELILSFDVPTRIGSSDFDPADLVRFVRTGPSCGAWALAASPLAFDASSAGIPTSSNVIGADQVGTTVLLSFDVPTDLGPPGITTYLPGQIVSWDGAAFAMFQALPGWPISSRVDGLSLIGNPGVVPPTIVLAKVPSSSDLIVTWSASCSEGGVDYGIYQGTIGSWASHTLLDCADDGASRVEQITPGTGSGYFLVVPRNGVAEGSYGQRRTGPSAFSERPVGTARCVAQQVVTPCPP